MCGLSLCRPGTFWLEAGSAGVFHSGHQCPGWLRVLQLHDLSTDVIQITQWIGGIVKHLLVFARILVDPGTPCRCAQICSPFLSTRHAWLMLAPAHRSLLELGQICKSCCNYIGRVLWPTWLWHIWETWKTMPASQISNFLVLMRSWSCFVTTSKVPILGFRRWINIVCNIALEILALLFQSLWSHWIWTVDTKVMCEPWKVEMSKTKLLRSLMTWCVCDPEIPSLEKLKHLDAWRGTAALMGYNLNLARALWPFWWDWWE